jgi:hypothetical protein
MVNGKRKGSGYEREVAKILSWWLTEGRRDDAIIRSVNSGGWNTIRKKKGVATRGQEGDLQANSEQGREFLSIFTLEIKTGYGKWCLLDVIDSPRQGQQQFDKFLSQVDEASKTTKTEPLLIFRRTGRKSVVCMSNLCWNACRDSSDFFRKTVKIYGSIKKNGRLFWFVPLDDFVSGITWTQLDKRFFNKNEV